MVVINVMNVNVMMDVMMVVNEMDVMADNVVNVVEVVDVMDVMVDNDDVVDNKPMMDLMVLVDRNKVNMVDELFKKKKDENGKSHFFFVMRWTQNMKKIPIFLIISCWLRLRLLFILICFI